MADGEALAEAIRNGQCALFDPTLPEVIYTTNPAMRAMILNDLSNGSTVKSTHANRVRTALKNFKGIDFLQGSKPQAEF